MAEGDTVVARVTWRATHQGTFFGIPPTGRAITVPAISIWRIVDGKVVEHWGVFDSATVLQQLGVFP